VVGDIIWQVLGPFDQAINVLTLLQIHVDVSTRTLLETRGKDSGSGGSSGVSDILSDDILFDLFLLPGLVVF
jgi:hypothetical protein